MPESVEDLQAHANLAVQLREPLEGMLQQLADRFPAFEVAVVLGYKGTGESVIISYSGDPALFAKGLQRWATKKLQELDTVGDDGG